MSLKTRIAFRYLAGKRSYFLSFSNLIAFLGIVIGLFSLIIVSSVMSGLKQDMTRRIVSAKGEVRVYQRDFRPFYYNQEIIQELMEAYTEIVEIGEVNQNEVLLRKGNFTTYSESYGVDFIKHQEISDILQTMIVQLDDYYLINLLDTLNIDWDILTVDKLNEIADIIDISDTETTVEMIEEMADILDFERGIITKNMLIEMVEMLGMDNDKISNGMLVNIANLLGINLMEVAFKNNGIVLGLELSYLIGTYVGDTIDVVSPTVLTVTPSGLIPKMERYRVVGILHTKFPEFDRLYSFIDIENSKRLRTHDGVDYLQIKTNITNLDFNELVQKIEKDFPHLRAEHWEIFDKTLFSAIKIEQIAMFAVMAIILVLASFNITGNFIRTATEKKEEIALLKAIGMNKSDIRNTFIIMGLLVGIAGVIVANILAYILMYLQVTREFVQIPIAGFPFTAVPVEISFSRMAQYSLLALVICLIGTLYPAIKTLKINIIDVIKDESL